ncbi:hypothetical protein D3C71_2204130 [compost metagenome]
MVSDFHLKDSTGIQYSFTDHQIGLGFVGFADPMDIQVTFYGYLVCSIGSQVDRLFNRSFKF